MEWDNATKREIQSRAEKLADEGLISGQTLFYLQQGKTPHEKLKEDFGEE